MGSYFNSTSLEHSRCENFFLYAVPPAATMAFLCSARAHCCPHAGSKTGRQAGRQSEDVHNRLFASPGEVPTSAIVGRTERERLGKGGGSHRYEG